MENWSFRFKKLTLRADRVRQHAEDEFTAVQIEAPKAATPGGEQLKKLTWERTVKKGWKTEDLKKRREKDRQPFRKATAAEEATGSSEEEFAGKNQSKQEEGRGTAKKVIRKNRTGEDTPFRMAGQTNGMKGPR